MKRIVACFYIALSWLFASGLAHAADPLKIGFVGGQTGYMAQCDQPNLKGMELAVAQINAKGGIDGKLPIELIARDSRSEVAPSAVMAQELLSEGVTVMISPCDVDHSVAVAQITAAAQVPTISSCASTPSLASVGGEFMFINCTPDNLQGGVLGKYAAEQGYKRALVLVSRDTPYTYQLPMYFADAFKKAGGELIGTVEYKLGQQDFAAEVTKIKALQPQPDVIMTSAYEPDFPAFLKQLRSAGVTAAVLGSDGLDSPTIWGLGAVADGVVFSTAGFPVEGSSLAQFASDYKQHFGEESQTSFNATGYDIIKIIEAAVVATGDKTDGKSIRDAIDNLQDVQVATGKITYRGLNRIPLRSVALNKVQDGKKTFVSTVTLQPGEIPPPN
ncbi:ABC transporter substrate-binding protein [Aestuariivirga sp. YIM B02566]|uniref:ABC transporter substrate-binding protein n=1 Tax=Taklimakanibacter albus TaxID=2800327 RepID=A0ACC5R088_9HYPH|nr:ABC transporter substrate-binding protein [Aestuariivirga sp. YIM B02566]